MRKVIMLVTLSGERHHFIPGEEVEFEAEEAQRLVESHFAKYVEEQEESVEPDKNTVKPDDNVKKPISKMNKDELLQYAESIGVIIDPQLNKKEIIALVEKSEIDGNK